MKCLILLVTLALLVSACSSSRLSPSAAMVRDIDAKDAYDCRFLGDITTTDSSGMLFVESGIKAARAKARNQAAEMGASHILWGTVSAGGAVQAVSAKAYYCSA